MSADISVLLATHDGGAVLGRTLEAYARLQPPKVTWKLIVIDNGSTDGSSELIGRYRDRLPLTLLQQPVLGKNRALNLGLSEAEGELIVFTDDDALPAPDFIDQWSKCLGGHKGYQLFGASIQPHFDTSPPPWLTGATGHVDVMFAGRDLPEGPIEAVEIFGPNMAVRAQVFADGFRFDEQIGPNGSDAAYPMGSETEFCRRVGATGRKAWFHRGPFVEHIVRPHQMTLTYFKARACRHGRGAALQDVQAGDVEAITGMLSGRGSIKRRLARPVMAMATPPLPFHDALWTHHWYRGYLAELKRHRWKA